MFTKKVINKGVNALERGHVEETDREKPQNYVKIQLLKGVVFNILVFCG